MIKTRTKHGCIAALITLRLAVNALGEELPKGGSGVRSKNIAWTLSTDDTELTLAVPSNTISLTGLRNPAQKWNWIPTPSQVPMPGVQRGTNYQTLNWEFREATEDRTNGHQVTLRFTCAEPVLELASVWRANRVQDRWRTR